VVSGVATFAGEVEVTVTPDLSRFRADLERGTLRDAEQVAARIGQVMGRTAGKLMADGIKDSLDRMNFTAVGAQTGRQFGREFAKVANAEIRSALKDATVKVTADTARARQEINALSDNVTVNVDANVDRAFAEITALHELADEPVTVNVDADTKPATAAVEDFEERSNESAPRAGGRYGGAFGRAIKTALQAALQALPEVEINADSSDADREIAGVRSELKALSDKRVGIDIDADEARRQITVLQERLSVLSSNAANIQVRVDAAAAQAKLAAFSAQVARVSADDVNVDVDVDTGAARASLLALSVQASATSIGLRGVYIAAIAISPALAPIGAVGVGALMAVAGAAGAAAAGIGTLALGLAPVIGAVQAMGQATGSSGQSASRAAGQHDQLASAVRGVEDAHRAVERATRDAAQAEEDSARRIEDATQALDDAQAEAARDRVTALRGIRDAERDLADAQDRAAQDRLDAVQAVTDAEQALSDAQADGERSRLDSLRRIADAEQGVGDAQDRAADSRLASLRDIERAERSMADAARDVLGAEQDLADARNEAADNLASYSERLTRADLDERSAVLDLADAQQRLADVEVDPGATDAERERARIAVERATLSLADQRDEAAALRDEQAAAVAAGVDGAERVRSAQERLADAHRDAADAARAVDDARAEAVRREQGALDAIGAAEQALTDARDEAARRAVEADRASAEAQRALDEARAAAAQQELDGARAIADAQRDLDDARARSDLQRQDSLRAIADAEQAVADAQDAAAEAQIRSAEAIADAQRGVVDAQRGVQEASKSAGEVGSASVNKLNDAMAKLTPEGVAFATFIRGTLIPAFRELSRTAQTGMLPGLQAGLTAMLPILPVITDLVDNVARAMGGLFQRAGQALGGPFWMDFFTFIADTAGPALTIMGETIGNFTEGLAALFMAFYPVSLQFGEALLSMSQAFSAWAQGAAQSEAFQSFLAYIRDTGPLVAQILGALVLAVTNIAVGLAPLGDILLRVILAVSQFIAALDPIVITAVAVAIGAVVAAMTVLNAVMAVAALEAIPLGLVIGVVIAAVVALGAALVYAYQHSETFRDIVNTAWAAIRDTVVAAWEGFIQPALQAMWSFLRDDLGPVFSWLWRNIVVPAFTGIYLAVQYAWNTVISPIFTNIALFVRTVLGPVFKWLYDSIISPVWTAIHTAINVAWNDVVLPVFRAINRFVLDVLGPLFTTYLRPAIELAWSLISTAISIAWVAIKVVFAAVKLYIETVLAPVFKWLYETIIKPVWDKVSSKISTVWNTGIKPVFKLLGDYITDHLAPAFKLGVDAISEAWERVADVAKKPIRFIVDTVINKGIIAPFKTVASWFDVDSSNIRPIKLPEGFASGGYIRGPGSGTSDEIPAWLSDGEYVIRSAAVKKLGVRYLDLLNRADEYDLGGDPSGTARFADGGRVQAAKAWLPSVDPLPYVWGAVGPYAYDCCLPGRTLVAGPYGPKRIDELEPGDIIWSRDDEGSIVEKKIVDAWRSIDQITYRLRLRGRNIDASANHPFLRVVMTSKPHGAGRFNGKGVRAEWDVEWTRLDELKRGDLVVVLDEAPDMGDPHPVLPDGTEVTEELAWLLGAIIGDGTVTDDGVRLAAFGDFQDDAIRAFASVCGLTATPHATAGLIVNSRKVASSLREIGMWRRGADKRVPDVVWSWSRDLQLAFARGYGDADGYDGRDGRSYAGCSRRLIDEVRTIHLQAGHRVTNVTVNRRKKPITIKGKLVKNALPLYSFTVSGYDREPYANMEHDKPMVRRMFTGGAFGLRSVAGIDELEVEATYDLNVEGHHNFVADGVVVHNSGLTGEAFNRLEGRQSYRRAFTTSSDFGSLGFARGLGLYTIGVDPGQHMAGALGGLPFEAASTASGIFVGANAKSVTSFPQQWYLKDLGGSKSGEHGLLDILDPIGSLIDMIRKPLRLLQEIDGYPFGRLAAGMPIRLVDEIVEYAKGILPGFSAGGLVEYDDGGWLPPGLSTVVNNTGSPEPVLSGGQWDAIRGGGDTQVGPIDVKVFVGDQEITDIVRTEISMSEADTVARVLAGVR
jgi:intein/homing endonuclease